MTDAVAKEAFRSADLLVRATGEFSDAVCVVTFDSFTDERTLDRAGFGESFLTGQRIDAVHVIPRDNDWYQYPEMLDAMARVREATRRYRRVVTYGSSMGGYAAIRFAGVAGAGAALALAPQFSIDPKVARFERRWPERSRAFRPLWERTLPLPALDAAHVVYDPADTDRRQVALLAKAGFAFTPVRLREAGHHVGHFLHDLGLLQPTVLAAFAGQLDVAAVERAAWAGRERSPRHWAALAAQARPNDHRRREACLRAALRLEPEDRDVKCLLANALSRAGRFEEALALHRDALASLPGHPNLMLHYSYTLERSGDVAGALAVMEDVAARTADASLYRARLEKLRAATEHRPPARGWLRPAVPVDLHGAARRLIGRARAPSS